MKDYHVLNLGAGVQSTCLYLLAHEGKFKFDVAIFADTQEEPKAVYDHLAWLQSLGGNPPIWVRTAGKLGDDLLTGRNSEGQRFASIPAFTGPDHLTREEGWKQGILRRQCSREYKVEVVVKAIRRELIGLKYRQHIPKDVRVYQYFGITTDERSRMKTKLPEPWAVPVYPLVEMGWSRMDCIAWLKGKVPHTVPKSACVFCPYHDNAAWQHLKDTDPEGWNRAVEIDRALRDPANLAGRGLDNKPYLHRSCFPLEQVDFQAGRTPDLPMAMENECEGLCGV